MPMEIQSVVSDIASGRGSIIISNPEANETVQVNFPMNFSGDDTLNHAETMVRSRVKQLLQAALAVL